MRTITICIAALCALFLTPSLLAQSDQEKQVGDTLDAWHRAAASSDFDRYFSFLTEDSIFVGTDATEHWTVEQFKDYAREPFANGRGWNIKPTQRRIRLSTDGNTAWVVERLAHTGMGELRGSGVLVRTTGSAAAGEWRISQYVLSLPIPNEVTDDVVEKIEEHNEFGNILGTWYAAVLCDGGKIEFKLKLQRANDVVVGEVVNGEFFGVSTEPVSSADYVSGKLILRFEHYNSVIEAGFDSQNNQLVGTWTKIRGHAEDATLQFHASREKSRHAIAAREALSLSSLFQGKYRAKFESSEDDAILELSRTGDCTSGTFRTTTGDYRFLHGTLIDNQLTLSTFDGAHAFLFKATQHPDGSLKGDFWSGNWWHETWTAVPDQSATLRDPWRMTTANPQVNLADLEFPNLDGNMRALDDPEFAGKCKIIEVFGTWCPNCMDATKELKRLRNKYAHEGLSVLALAFEVTGDPQRDTAQVQRYIEITGINYPVLLAGTSNKTESSKAFPFIDKVRSYPTFIFLDSRDRVRAIYTGFSGPATGDAFKKQQREFEELIETILSEK